MRLRPGLLSVVVAMAFLGCERKQAPAPSAEPAAPAAAQRPTGPLIIGTVGALTGHAGVS